MVSTSSPNPIHLGEPNTIITADASLGGWGTHITTQTAGGCWLEGDGEEHINALELKAILFGLKSLLRIPPSHVRVLVDNTIAMAYIKKYGRHQI